MVGKMRVRVASEMEEEGARYSACACGTRGGEGEWSAQHVCVRMWHPRWKRRVIGAEWVCVAPEVEEEGGGHRARSVRVWARGPMTEETVGTEREASR